MDRLIKQRARNSGCISARQRTLCNIRSGLVRVLPVLTVFLMSAANATEGGLGRPVAGTSVLSGIGMVPPENITIVGLQQLYLDGSIGGSRDVPIAGKASVGLDGQVALTLASVIHGWGGSGGWNFASGITVPYIWTQVSGKFGAGQLARSTSDRASNLYDLYVTPIEAGYSITETDHIALSFSFWAPTGKYDANALANASLNNWTFVPQIAYTKSIPRYGLEFDAVAALQFYTRNHATDYQNAPLFTLDLMGLKRFANGVGIGVVMGTVQQLGNDTGPTADRFDGFVGHDFSLGPIISYDTKIGGKAPFSASIRWIPSITSTNRLKSTNTFMATATLVF